jgi:hypothetical protein
LKAFERNTVPHCRDARCIAILALPATLCGIVTMLFITGTTLNVPSLMGAIMAVGVASANSKVDRRIKDHLISRLNAGIDFHPRAQSVARPCCADTLSSARRMGDAHTIRLRFIRVPAADLQTKDRDHRKGFSAGHRPSA